MLPRLYKATILDLLLVGAVLATSAGAQMVFLPNCNLQEVNLVPCMVAAGGMGGGGNISDACCSSLNKALDAGHRCVCSVLLSNGVFASLVTNLLTLPLVLPLPGCFLYAPSLADCQATLQQPTNSPPAAATSAVPSAGGAAGTPVDPPTPPATIAPPEKKGAGPEKAEDPRTGNGTSEAAPREGQSVSRSNPCRSPSNAAEGTAYTLTFAAAVIAVFWLNCVTDYS